MGRTAATALQRMPGRLHTKSAAEEAVGLRALVVLCQRVPDEACRWNNWDSWRCLKPVMTSEKVRQAQSGDGSQHAGRGCEWS